jgi:predicted nucleotidyltransferase
MSESRASLRTRDVDAALRAFAAAARSLLGPKLCAMYLFGSRARGDHRPLSDVDLAVVLADPIESRWQEADRLGRLAFPIEVETGLRLHIWPFARSEWGIEDSPPGTFLANAKRDAIAVTP